MLELTTADGNPFGLSNSQADLFQVLMARESCTRQELMTALYGKLGAQRKDDAVLYVFIKKMREKLDPFGIAIVPIHGKGYSIPPESKKNVM